jgi:putative sigma-54 modulation protein
MKIQMHSLKFNADQKLLDYVQKKVNKLDTLYDRVVDGEVILRLNNEGTENKTVEIKLNVPGSQVFSKEDSDTFEKSTDQAVESIRRQLNKFKERVRSH